MKRTLLLSVLSMLLLCGCTHAESSSIGSTAEETAAPTAEIPVVTPKETTAPPQETIPFTPAVPEQTPAEVLESYADNDPLQFQGGIGGEEHAETPLPEYFTYRFVPDSVTMRLAGGNYQSILFDFSETVAHDGFYYLSDQNEDGYFDLFAPIKYDGDDIITCAVFLWIPENGKFAEEPEMYECPPNFKLQKEEINEE